MSTITTLNALDSGATSRPVINTNFSNLNTDKAETTALTAHTGSATGVHGITGSVVGSTDTQTLTNKTLVTPTIASFANANHNHTNSAGGGQLTDAALSTVVSVAKGGTGANTLAVHGVVLGNAGSAVAVTSPGASGQVFTSNGAGADPSFQAISAISPKMRVQTDFEATGRFSTNLQNTGSVTLGTSGATLSTGGTAQGFAASQFRGAVHVNASLFAPISVFWSIFSISALASTGDMFFGIGTPPFGASGTDFTAAHIGFKVLISGSTATLYATTSAGTETATSIVTIAQDDVMDIVCKINSTSSVDFYYRKNGGTFTGPTTITTNIPTSTQNSLQCSVNNNNTAVTQTVVVSTMGIER